MKESEIIENGIYQLQPLSDKPNDNWCKHNILIAHKKDNDWIFKDTYWTSEPTKYKFEDIKDRIKFAFDLNHSKEVHEKEFNQYNEKDKFWIPIGGNSEKHLIDTRATKSKNNIIELLEYAIEDKKRDIEILNNNIKRHTSDLKNVNDGGDLNNIYI